MNQDILEEVTTEQSDVPVLEEVDAEAVSTQSDVLSLPDNYN